MLRLCQRLPLLVVAVLCPCGTAADVDSIVPLWDHRVPVPATADLVQIPNVRFSVIKQHAPDQDGGYGFLHGVALEWHRNRLYASWGHNRAKENTDSEEARGRVSTDGGRTWSPTFDIDPGTSRLGVSHGVFRSVNDQLWAWMGAFHRRREQVHTRAYLLNEETGDWDFQGVAVADGFWPMEPPVRLADGNWMMAGLICGHGDPAAVAISHGDNLLKWDLVEIPGVDEGRMWGESTTFIHGTDLVNVSRYGSRAVALSAISHDQGRTWTQSRPSRLPMATSKPFAGTLSTGQHYLVCTTVTDGGKRRSPLTIALSRPGERVFSQVLKIRDAVCPDPHPESHPDARLSYPYAVEQNGHLYVGYSNSAGRTGMNINTAELAVIPIGSLQQ